VGPTAPSGAVAPTVPAPSAAGGTGSVSVTGDDPGTTAPNDPANDMVVPEQPGEIVAPVPAKKLAKGGFAVAVTVPTTPGLYRLVAPPAGPVGAVASSMLPAGLEPGATADVEFQLTAPTVPGEYLVILDVVDPTTGSLAAAGVPPGIVRVTVAG